MQLSRSSSKTAARLGAPQPVSRYPARAENRRKEPLSAPRAMQNRHREKIYCGERQSRVNAPRGPRQYCLAVPAAAKHSTQCARQAARSAAGHRGAYSAATTPGHGPWMHSDAA